MTKPSGKRVCLDSNLATRGLKTLSRTRDRPPALIISQIDWSRLP